MPGVTAAPSANAVLANRNVVGRLSLRWVVAGICVILAVVAVVLLWRPGGVQHAVDGIAGAAKAVVPLKVADREFALVDEYLKKNLDDPNYEVVQWWPAIDRTEKLNQEIASCEKMIPVHEESASNSKKRLDALIKERSAYLLKKSKLENQIEENLQKNAGRLSKKEYIKIKNPPELDAINLEIRKIEKEDSAMYTIIHESGREIEGCKNTIEHNRELLKEKPCRLKFRASNRFGAKQIQDVVFLIQDRKVRATIDDSESWQWQSYARLFDKK